MSNIKVNTKGTAAVSQSQIDDETPLYDALNEFEALSESTTHFNFDDSSISPEVGTSSVNNLQKRRRDSTLDKQFESELVESAFSIPSGTHSPVTRPSTSASASTRRRCNFSSGESVSEYSSDITYGRNERTEMLKTLLTQRAQPKQQTLTPLQNLFLSFADTVASFPERIQIETKQKIFQIITDQELKLSLEKQQIQIIDSSQVKVLSIENGHFRITNQIDQQEIIQEDNILEGNEREGDGAQDNN